MAKNRIVKTNFRTDPWVEMLDPSEKLVYLYLLTNDYVDLCGIYEISLRRISFETGFEQTMIQKILDRFNNDNKIHYVNGWIYIKNFVKNQSTNPSVKKGIERSLSKIPGEILDKMQDLDREGIDYIQSVTPTGKVKYSNIYIINKQDIIDLLGEKIKNYPKGQLSFVREFIEKGYKVHKKEKDLVNLLDRSKQLLIDYGCYLSTGDINRQYGEVKIREMVDWARSVDREIKDYKQQLRTFISRDKK